MALLDPLMPLAPTLDRVLDPLTIRLGRSVLERVGGPPLRRAHAETRERALDDVAQRWIDRADETLDGVRARDRSSIDRYDTIVARAVDELRGDAEARAVSCRSARLQHAVDRLLYTNRPEWLDDPSFDATLRVRTLDRLDCLNEALGSYEAFLRVIEPLVERARASGVERPTIVDLASGHAMFAVRIALSFGAREGKVRVVATDLRDEYLSIGRAHARRLGLRDGAIDFVVQDALDLRDLEEKIGARADVVCCTQSVHHFPPGFVARLFAEAARAARHGAIVVDGERNPFALLLVTMMSGWIGRGSVPFLHDAVVSIRRMYTEQELALIARLAPGETGAGVEVKRGWAPPGFVWMASG